MEVETRKRMHIMNSFDLIFMALASPLIGILLYGFYVFHFDPTGKTTKNLTRWIKQQ